MTRMTTTDRFAKGWVAGRFPALVQRIASAGRGVASDGYHHHLIYVPVVANCD